MNDPESPSGPSDMVDTVWASLRRIEPPLETRVASRKAVAAELVRIAERRRVGRLPFWQRTVAVPWPAAGATMAVLVTLSILSFRSGVGPLDMSRSDLPKDREQTEQPREDRIRIVSEMTTEYHESTYLCGIGPLRSETRYLFEKHER